jgi:hypothetical protein
MTTPVAEDHTDDEALALAVTVVAALAVHLRESGVTEAEIAADLDALEGIGAWMARPVWEMDWTLADTFFGEQTARWGFSARVMHAQAVARYFTFLAIPPGAALLAEAGLISPRCPVDALNWPRPRTPGPCDGVFAPATPDRLAGDRLA